MLLSFVALVACGKPAFQLAGLKPGPRSGNYQDHVVATKLQNGLTLAMLPDARTNLVTVTVRYEAGAADDPPAALGLAHYVEHVLYLASQRGRDDIVLSGNAMTQLDTTYFYQTALDSQLDALVETAAARFEIPCTDLPAAELERERDVVIEEVKQRTQTQWNMDGIQAALWGSGHPYSHSPAGTTFSTISRDALCSFIDGHYGPGDATVVVTGNVSDAAFARIKERLAKIKSRAIAPRPQLPAFDDSDVHIRVPGLEHATVVLAFPVPGEVGRSATAIRLLDGMVWHKGRQRLATQVVGDDRARMVLAYAEVDDPTQVDEIARQMRDLFADTIVGNLELAKQRVRTEVVRSFDSLEAAGIAIADLAARGEPLTRYRAIRQIDEVTTEGLAHWIAGAPARLVVMVPDSNTANLHSLAELKTELHHLDLVHPDTAVDLAPPTVPARPHADITTDTLTNGLHVVYAPDPKAIGVDARVVMPFDPGSGKDLVVAFEAATELQPQPVNGDDLRILRWYATVGVPVDPSVTLQATTMSVSGLALFGDWHVWNLARSVVSGGYPEVVDAFVGQRVAPDTRATPTANEVIANRLGVLPDRDQITYVSRDTLDRFRATHYDPRHATLIVAGNFDLAAMRREVTTLFSPWHAGTFAAAPPAKPTVRPGFVAIPTLHANTLEIEIAFAPSSRGHADEAARAVLQEMINARLRTVRESLGASYGVYAEVTNDYIMAGGSIEPAYAADGARAISAALNSIRATDKTFDADFAAARKRVLSNVLGQPLGASARARQLQRAVEASRSPTDLDAEIEAVRTLDVATVRTLAARELVPDRMVTVVRGDADPVKAALTAFGATAFDTVDH